MTQYIKQKENHKIHTIKKASAWASAASVTVEAALALPLFFFAVLCLIYQLEIQAITLYVEEGAASAAKIAAKEIYMTPLVLPSSLEADMVKGIGSERLDRSIVENGSSGLNCSGSYVTPGTGILHLKVSYQVKLPFPKFAVPPVTRKAEVKIKGWIGYEKEGLGDQNSQIVYITDHASVYHKDYQCTHLQLSVQMVLAADVENLRNGNGGKYHACEICGKRENTGAVYITDDGNRYHTSAGCSGLKRTIYAVPLSEVAGKGACSRCGQSVK